MKYLKMIAVAPIAIVLGVWHSVIFFFCVLYLVYTSIQQIDKDDSSDD